MGEFDDEELKITSGGLYDNKAYDVIKLFFEEHKDKVFFGRQIEVIHEQQFYHWVSNRSLRKLAEDGIIKREQRVLKTGGIVMIYWHNSLRYYKRPAQNTVGIVESYSKDIIGSSIGAHGEFLVIEGFAKLQFLLKGRNTSGYNGTKWTATAHNLDLIIEKDGIAYGVEVKNTLGYIDKEEYEIKMKMCKHLGIRPVFAARMLPVIWNYEIYKAGGFALIMKYLMYPEYLQDLAATMKNELFLPVDTPKSLYDGTLNRFNNWHLKNVK